LCARENAEKGDPRATNTVLFHLHSSSFEDTMAADSGHEKDGNVRGTNIPPAAWTVVALGSAVLAMNLNIRPWKRSGIRSIMKTGRRGLSAEDRP
jgi:hypothetical protein